MIQNVNLVYSFTLSPQMLQLLVWKKNIKELVSQHLPHTLVLLSIQRHSGDTNLGANNLLRLKLMQWVLVYAPPLSSKIHSRKSDKRIEPQTHNRSYSYCVYSSVKPEAPVVAIVIEKPSQAVDSLANNLLIEHALLVSYCLVNLEVKVQEQPAVQCSQKSERGFLLFSHMFGPEGYCKGTKVISS